MTDAKQASWTSRVPEKPNVFLEGMIVSDETRAFLTSLRNRDRITAIGANMRAWTDLLRDCVKALVAKNIRGESTQEEILVMQKSSEQLETLSLTFKPIVAKSIMVLQRENPNVAAKVLPTIEPELQAQAAQLGEDRDGEVSSHFTVAEQLDKIERDMFPISVYDNEIETLTKLLHRLQKSII